MASATVSLSCLPRNQILDRFDRALFGRSSMMSTPSGACDDRRAFLTADPVAAEVQRNSVEPGRELRLALESGQRPKGPEKGFLGTRPARPRHGRSPGTPGHRSAVPSAGSSWLKLSTSPATDRATSSSSVATMQGRASTECLCSLHCVRRRARPESRPCDRGLVHAGRNTGKIPDFRDT